MEPTVAGGRLHRRRFRCCLFYVMRRPVVVLSIKQTQACARINIGAGERTWRRQAGHLLRCKSKCYMLDAAPAIFCGKLR